MRRSITTSDVFVLARFNNAAAPELSISQFCKSRATQGEKKTKFNNNYIFKDIKSYILKIRKSREGGNFT